MKPIRSLTQSFRTAHVVAITLVVISACSVVPQQPRLDGWQHEQVSAVELDGASDDLLTAGLGLDGLRNPMPPAFADPLAPTAQELRRLAYHNNFRALLDLTDAGGFSRLFGFGSDQEAVPGREYLLLGSNPAIGLSHVMVLQVPDTFASDQPCLVAAPSSGSRGVYAAVGTVGAWALQKGCAVVYTDKGTGNWAAGLADGQVMHVDGRMMPAEQVDYAEPFSSSAIEPMSPLLALKHAHSGVNPEAYWGDMVLHSIEVAMHLLADQGHRFSHDDLTVVAASVSNGGGAVLHAAELDEADWIDGVVASEPMVITAASAWNLYQTATHAAIYEPCAALAMPDAPMAAALALARPLLEARCRALVDLGMLVADRTDVTAMAEAAMQQMARVGRHPSAAPAMAFNTYANLWGSIAGVYGNAYARASFEDQLCGVGIAAVGPTGQATHWPEASQVGFAGSGSGIPPTSGLEMVAISPSGVSRLLLAPGVVDGAFDYGLGPTLCLHALGGNPLPEQAQTFAPDPAWLARAASGQAAVVRSGDPGDRPVIIVHGQADGLVYASNTSRPYVETAWRAGRNQVVYIEVANAQHFDALLALPGFNTQYVPLSPYFDHALEQIWTHLLTGEPLPASQLIDTTPRASDASGAEALNATHVPPIGSDPGESAIYMATDGLFVPSRTRQGNE